MKWLKKMDENFEEWISAVLFSLMVILILFQVIFRFVLNFSLDWTEEMARFTFIFLVYFSASIAVKKGRHLRTQAIEQFLPAKLAKWFRIFSDVIWLVFTVYMIKIGYTMAMTILASGQKSPVLQWTMGNLYMIVPIGFLLISLRIIQQIIKTLVGQDTAIDPAKTTV